MGDNDWYCTDVGIYYPCRQQADCCLNGRWHHCKEYRMCRAEPLPNAEQCVQHGRNVVAGTFQHLPESRQPVHSDEECMTRCRRTPSCTAWVTNWPEIVAFDLQWRAAPLCWMTSGSTQGEANATRNMGLRSCQATTETATTTTTMTTGTGDDFEPVTEAMDQACRGATHSDNSADYFQITSSQILDQCKAACRAMPHHLCKGIEYSQGRCELWTRPEGIGATKGVTGFTCLRNKIAPIFVPLEGGRDRACRGAAASDNSASYYHIAENVDSLQDCQSACMREPGCVGIEFGGRCELWTRPQGIQAVIYLSGSTCMAYQS